MFFELFLLSSIYISTINGWGATGHSLVAKIAQSTLTKDAQKFVSEYLPWYAKGDLSMVASWADTILYSDTNPGDYLNWQWSKELHYVNTPEWLCSYDRDRDCDWEGGQRCVDGTIQNYTSRLVDAKQDDTQREEALKFLVHFIGDVHQPLHAGFASDRGGNSIRGTFFGRSTNLHSLWDTLMIERRISLDFQGDANEYYKYLLNTLHTTYASKISQWSRCPSADQSRYLACSTAWIDEDIELNCEHVYRDESDKQLDPSTRFNFGQTYFNTRMVIVEQRLLQGGVRLGVVINKIVQLQERKRKQKHHKKQEKELCSGTQLLFAVIFIEFLLVFFALMCCLVRRTLYQQPSKEVRSKNHISNDEKV